MQIIHQNLKKGEIKLRVDNLDDLWHLSQIIDKGDIVQGDTVRKIRIGDKDERNSNAIKKRMFLSINAEKIEFNENSLRVLGGIIEGPSDIKKGAHHSFVIENSTKITIIKKKWMGFQLDKIKEACSTKQPSILICVLDREEAIFALPKRSGYEILSEIKGNVQKKDDNEIKRGDFYSEIILILEEYDKRYNIENIIIASPAFWKEYLIKSVKDPVLKKKITLATCSSVGNNAVDEVLKRPEVKEVLSQLRFAKEMKLVEELLFEISKKRNAAYGFKEVENASHAGAVKLLLVTDKLIKKMREKEDYDLLDNVIKLVDSMDGEISIISSEHDGGKRLDGLGGIGAILRYQIS